MQAELSGPGCFQAAKQKARYGHQDWIAWTIDGASYADRATAENLKKMLLAIGTKGKWSLINANCGTPMKGFWRIGINLINYRKRGM